MAGTDRVDGTAQEQKEPNDMPPVKEEPTAQDPLRLELDDDDLDRRARYARAQDKQDKARQDAAEAEAVREGTEEAQGGQSEPAPEPTYASSPAALAKLKSTLLHAAVDRICAVGASSGAAMQAGGGDKDLWIQLISRLVTRGLTADTPEDETEVMKREKDSIRKQLFDFVTADLSERIELARLWLNEEWYTEKASKTSAAAAGQSAYATWLHLLLDQISSSSIDKEKGTSFTQFLIDLPEIPKEEVARLAKMCEEPTA